MDLSSLESLGEVAGLGGIAIGVVALLVRPVIDRTSSVPVMGAFGIGTLGIIAWLVSGLPGGNVTVISGQGGLAAGRDISGNTITLPAQGGSATPASPAMPTTPAGKPL